jgi:hypothetical protein
VEEVGEDGRLVQMDYSMSFEVQVVCEIQQVPGSGFWGRSSVEVVELGFLPLAHNHVVLTFVEGQRSN